MHFERLGFHLELPNHSALPKISPGIEYLAPNRICKADMTKWINQSGLDDETKASLTKTLASCPANTMHHFFKNIHKYIAKIHEARQNNIKLEEINSNIKEEVKNEEESQGNSGFKEPDDQFQESTLIF